MIEHVWVNVKEERPPQKMMVWVKDVENNICKAYLEYDIKKDKLFWSTPQGEQKRDYFLSWKHINLFPIKDAHVTENN